jgi:hypothetical protein
MLSIEVLLSIETRSRVPGVSLDVGRMSGRQPIRSISWMTGAPQMAVDIRDAAWNADHGRVARRGV